MVQYEFHFRRELFENIDLKNYVDDHPPVIAKPLEPRDCLDGGRCNGLLVYHDRSGNEQIHYTDFTSFYPECCKYFKIPTSHPIIHLGIIHSRGLL